MRVLPRPIIFSYSGLQVFGFFFAEISCQMLPDPANGFINYLTDTTAPFDYQTTAIYNCNSGFMLSMPGGSNRTCEGSPAGPGEWNGNVPTCKGTQTKYW